MQHARLGLMMPRVSVLPRQSWMGPCYCKDEAPRSCYFVGGKMGLYDAVRRLQHYDSAAECAEAVLNMDETIGEWTYNGVWLLVSLSYL
jgi:hypothetical protein